MLFNILKSNYFRSWFDILIIIKVDYQQNLILTKQIFVYSYIYIFYTNMI
jgi:hypothetical protein